MSEGKTNSAVMLCGILLAHAFPGQRREADDSSTSTPERPSPLFSYHKRPKAKVLITFGVTKSFWIWLK
jgi:hypothetical protein